jgi:molybdenum cofactor biosynthesis protein B
MAGIDPTRAFTPLSIAVLTISDTRSEQDDSSGALLIERLLAAGHKLAARAILRDDRPALEARLRELLARDDLHVILATGGTGVTGRDVTPEAFHAVYEKEIPGFGELFRMLSYQEIGAAAMLSRALGGLIDQTVVLVMPGSTAAVRLAMEKLVLPEIGHLVEHARR